MLCSRTAEGSGSHSAEAGGGDDVETIRPVKPGLYLSVLMETD